MPNIYPPIEPFKSGLLRVGNNDEIYWEVCGNPKGRPALVVHGGPGSGASPWWRMLFNPEKYMIILFDQRGCGRSVPSAADPKTNLSENTTRSLISDMENLRIHLDVEKWMLLGGSWGSTLALAYAEEFPEKVWALTLFGVTTGRYSEIDWTFKGGLASFFTEQWDRLSQGAREIDDGTDVVGAYYKMLNDPRTEIRKKAAMEWCMWESATPDWPPALGLQERFKNPDFAYGFARLVTHYISNYLFLEDGILLKNAHKLEKIPGILINGRYDFQAPLGNAWILRKAWPRSRLVVVDDSGHSASDSIEKEIVNATNNLALE